MKVAALAGGVGGAKLADGLAQVLPPDDFTVIVNTGDDWTHFGLKICPDLDTVCYTLANLGEPSTGWGRAGESFRVLEAARVLGGPDWFRLGDLDLGTHLERTRRLLANEPLSRITADFCRAWGVGVRVLPMTDDPVATVVETEEGELEFQEYFVHRQCRPAVRGFHFDGIYNSSPAPGVLDALREAELIVICPSNPWVSVDPILSVPGVRETLSSRKVIAVSPIIGGKAVKGPAAKMYAELGIEPSAASVARHYGAAGSGGLLSGFILDRVDRDQERSISAQGIRTEVLETLMTSKADRKRLAEEVLILGGRLVSRSYP